LSLFADYRKSLKLVEAEEILDLCVFRPVAFILVKAISWTAITPNQLTILSLATGIFAGVCYGFGRPAVVLAAGMYAFSVVLDCADGQLARLKKNGTRLGRILDGLIDYFVSASVYVGIYVGLAPRSERRIVWLLLLVAAGVSNIFHSVALDYYRSRFIEFERGPERPSDDDYLSFREELAALENRRGRVVRKTAIRLYLKYLDLQKRLTFNWNGHSSPRLVGKEDFHRKNAWALRGWTLLGSTTQETLLIVTSLLGRIDIYFWGMIVVANLWMAVMFAVQFRVDNSLVEEEAVS